MAGAYCKYCDHRCFVLRRLRDGRTIHLATCPAGKEHDRAVVGEDADTAVNPTLQAETAAQPDMAGASA